MAEIKSTLDLVLERTKNLTMTKEEKDALQRKDLEGKIGGWVQKHMDGLMGLKTVQSEITAIPEISRRESRAILKGLALGRLDPQGDNEKIFELLEGILGESRDPYLAAVSTFQEKTAAERSRFLQELRSKLAGRQISGSAVIPNLSRDEAWSLFYQKALEEFRKGIALNHPDN